ncbi:MAG: hypothetical protein Q4F67_13235, partial [Propionibacteriaceae bacterium]|nr:hypothetical protein [Propionibacteriaceae bacterium]
MRISKFAGLALVVTLAAAGCASPQPTADPRAAGPAAAPAAEIPGAESSAPAPADQRSTGDPVPTAAETAP